MSENMFHCHLPGHVIRSAATVALDGRQGGGVQGTAWGWSARRKGTCSTGAIAGDVSEPAAILYGSFCFSNGNEELSKALT